MVPYSIETDGSIALSKTAMSVLLVLLSAAHKFKSPISQNGVPVQLRMTTTLLMERSGYSENKIAEAVAELEGRFICRVKEDERARRGRFGSSVFQFLHPESGEPLVWAGSSKLYLNRQPSIRFFRFPRAVVDAVGQPWSLSALSPADTAVYVAMLMVANGRKTNVFTIAAKELQTLAGIATRSTFVKSVGSGPKPKDPEQIESVGTLESVRLVQLKHLGRELEIALCNPETGEPLYIDAPEKAEDDLSNYREQKANGAPRATHFNLSVEESEEMLFAALQDRAWHRQQNGNLMIQCPHHGDQNPSCSVDPKRHGFNCFGCGARGTFRGLIQKLSGWTTADYAQAVGRLRGQEIAYNAPDSSYEHIYAYRGADGKLIKRVCRFKGEKRFVQHRWTRAGWVDTNVPPGLYLRERLDFTSTIVLVEGEKDADRFNSLQLKSDRGEDLLAITSGGSKSWRPEFAAALSGKRVILLPDADGAGAEYARTVSHSLDSIGIQYQVIPFTEEGVKDVSDFLDIFPREALVEKLGDWAWQQEEQDDPVEV